jgi:hypothetical protein
MVTSVDRENSYAKLLDEVRSEAEAALTMYWTLGDAEMYLVVEWPEKTDRYLWSAEDGRYVYPLESSEDEERSA